MRLRAAFLRRPAAISLAPLFLAGALLVGGASLEGEFAQSVFFAVSGLIAAALFLSAGGWIKGAVATPLCFFLVLTALLLAQTVPLPAGWTSALPDRDEALASLALLGLQDGGLALSLTPEATLAGWLAFLAPLAGFCLMAAIKWSRGAAPMKWVIPLLGAASALLGLAQILLGDEIPALYFYEFTNRGSPVGVFSNANHQASFLLMCLPFAAVLAADLRRSWEGADGEMAQAALAAVMALLIVTGVLGAGSAAGYLLLVPVALFSLMIAFSGQGNAPGNRLAGWAMLPLIFGFAALIIFSSPRLSGLGVTSFDDTPGSRIAINRVSAEMAGVHWQAGTGLGSYADVYRLYEDPAAVSHFYVAHAHNDYFEWFIETGIAGGGLLAAFLAWWLYHFGRVWASGGQGSVKLRRAAAVAALVPVLHSLVDYPLRTPGIATLAAICLALMIMPKDRRAAPQMPAGDVEAEPVRTITI